MSSNTQLVERSQSYSGFEVSLITGSKRRQLLSNRLTVRVEGDRSDVEVRLTLRQAKALKRFLNNNV